MPQAYFLNAAAPSPEGLPPSRLEGGLHLNHMAPHRRGAGFSGATAPRSPESFVGAKTYLYRKALALWERIKLTKTRADYRVVIAMTVHHP